MVLDGWGIGQDKSVSAIAKAHTPFVDSLYQNYPNTTLRTSGMDVGLPEGQMGNSEVGHMNLGAGRVVYQDLVKINLAVADGSIEQNETLRTAFTYAKEQQKAVHLIGLVSDGGVHSHINHLKGLLSMAHHMDVKNTYVHAFTDGRDCDPKSGLGFIQDLQNHMAQSTGKIASITGRYYAMDRDKRWERVKLAYDAMVHAKGVYSTDALQAIENSYAANTTDEFIEPIVMGSEGNPITTIKEGDVVICFNFRTDRGREITMALNQNDFPDYNMKALDLHYVTLTMYDETFKKVHVAYHKENVNNTIGEVVENEGLKQIRIAETEKYPHVTFFFSGGREAIFNGEQRIMCPSPKVATYDLKPEMSAFDVRDNIVKELEKEEAGFVCLNFANPDMVGHTGVMEAAIKACETVDQCVKDVVTTGIEHGYTFIILADHGNCDLMRNKDGSPNTAHTTNPVPCFLVGNDVENISLKEGKLGDIAPTLLRLMDIEVPTEMTGEVLVYDD